MYSKDAAAIRGNNGGEIVVDANAFSFEGNMSKHGSNVSSYSTYFRSAKAKVSHLCQLVKCKNSIHSKLLLANFLKLLFAGIKLVPNGTNNFFKNVIEGYNTYSAPIFIHSYS